MTPEAKKRLKWIQLYEKTQDAGLVCRRVGISRPTLRKWLKRYQESGIDGLNDRSRKPHNSPNTKLNLDLLKKIRHYREVRQLGARRIQLELIRNESLQLSLATIHKALHKIDAKPLIRPKKRKQVKRYEMEIPGQRIQMDVTKIRAGLYQYTAIDDCTRYRVLSLYKRKTAKNTLDFIDKVIEEMPFPIQVVQTDRGGEFFALKVQKMLMKYSIKFRPIKPYSPHLNGKVERSQQTDLQEFYATIDLENISFEELDEELGYWQHHYNWYRPHSALGGMTPMDKYDKLSSKTPFWDEVISQYDPSQEFIREQNYAQDRKLLKLKLCV